MRRTRWKIYQDKKKNATCGDLSAGILSRPEILEHSTKGTNSEHEKSPLVRITLAYKIIAFTPLVVSHLHVHKGPAKRYDSLEWQEW